MFYGYKCFNKGLINRYSNKFEVGKEYHCDGVIQFGNEGNGFHVCKRLEDTLRYFDAMNKEVDLTKVRCHGLFDTYEDNYNDYFDMYAYEYMEIIKILTREEIIEYGLQLNELAVKRFLSLYKLKEEEIELFKEKYNNRSVLDTISYYQEGNKDTYTIECQNKILKYVKKDKI